MNRISTILLAALVMTFTFACGGEQQVASHQTTDQIHETPLGQTQESAPQTAAASAEGVQEATINVGGDYQPAAVLVKQGQPVRLNFYRADDKNCGGEVVFPELNIRKEIPVGQTTTVEFTPQKTGELAFTCGMDMMRGKVIVQ
jgi:plastocyanin domain-containing protein